MAMQMAIPFAIGPDGSVAVVTDPVQALGDRVRAMVGTVPGQRVMRATFGVHADLELFNFDAGIAQANLELMVQQAVAQYEPTAKVQGVSAVINPDGTEVLGVNVDVSAGDPTAPVVSDVYSVVISASGDVVPVS